MFVERLQGVSDRIEGAVALSLVAGDGIPVESVTSDDSFDLEFLAAELISQVRVISEDHRELSVGPVRHFSVASDRWTFIVSLVAEGYYLLLVLDKDANYGRARFELQRARLLFEEDLE